MEVIYPLQPYDIQKSQHSIIMCRQHTTFICHSDWVRMLVKRIQNFLTAQKIYILESNIESQGMGFGKSPTKQKWITNVHNMEHLMLQKYKDGMLIFKEVIQRQIGILMGLPMYSGCNPLESKPDRFLLWLEYIRDTVHCVLIMHYVRVEQMHDLRISIFCFYEQLGPNLWLGIVSIFLQKDICPDKYLLSLSLSVCM